MTGSRVAYGDSRRCRWRPPKGESPVRELLLVPGEARLGSSDSFGKPGSEDRIFPGKARFGRF